MADHQLVADLIVGTVADHIANHPRSRQVAIGPSEMGTPCARRIGHRLAGTPPAHVRPVAWLPFVGTALHAQMEVIFDIADLRHEREHGARAWLTETRVTVGQVNGQDITGSVDLHHLPSGTVVDHKFVGPTAMARYRREGPGEQYRIQVHLYGRGLANAGHQVRHVAILFWARNSDTIETCWWSEPYAPELAAAALVRADGVARSLQLLGPARFLPLLPTADAYCMHCPWWQPNATDLTTGCPGHPGSRADHTPPASLTEALGNPNGRTPA